MSWPMSEFYGSADLSDCEVQLFVQQAAEAGPKAKRVKLASTGSTSSKKTIVKTLPGHRLALKAASSKFRALLEPENLPPKDTQHGAEAKKEAKANAPKSLPGWFSWSSNNRRISRDEQVAVEASTPILEVNIRQESWLPSALAALKFFYAGPGILLDLQQSVLSPMIILGAELGARTMVESVIDHLLEQYVEENHHLQPETVHALISLQQTELHALKVDFGDKFDKLYSAMQTSVIEEYEDLESAWSNAVKRDSFLKLPFEAVLHILTSKRTKVASENTACLAAGMWLAHHRETIADDDAYTLLATIKLHQCSPAFLANVLPRLPLWGLLDKGRMIDLLYCLGHEAAMAKHNDMDKARQTMLETRSKSSFSDVFLEAEFSLEQILRMKEESRRSGPPGAPCVLNSAPVHFCGFAWYLQVHIPVGSKLEVGGTVVRDGQPDGSLASAGDAQDVETEAETEGETEGETEMETEVEMASDYHDLALAGTAGDSEVVDVVSSQEGEVKEGEVGRPSQTTNSSDELSWIDVVCQVPDVPLSRGASVGAFSSTNHSYPVLAGSCRVTTTQSGESSAARTLRELEMRRPGLGDQALMRVVARPEDHEGGAFKCCFSIQESNVERYSKTWVLRGCGKVTCPII